MLNYKILFNVYYLMSKWETNIEWERVDCTKSSSAQIMININQENTIKMNNMLECIILILYKDLQIIKLNFLTLKPNY